MTAPAEGGVPDNLVGGPVCQQEHIIHRDAASYWITCGDTELARCWPTPADHDEMVPLWSGATLERHRADVAEAALAASCEEVRRLHDVIVLAERCLTANENDWPRANAAILAAGFHPYSLAERETAQAAEWCRAALRSPESPSPKVAPDA